MSDNSSSFVVSVLVPTRNRPDLLKRCLSSVADQKLELIAEVLVGDDSDPEYFAANAAAIEASGLQDLIVHERHVPPLGNYPNQIHLGSTAGSAYMLILHDDDQLLEGALEKLVNAASEDVHHNKQVALWFGDLEFSYPDRPTDPQVTRELNHLYGRDGRASLEPLWKYCLTNAVPPDGTLIKSNMYREYCEGNRDGSVGDWGFNVRLACAGAHARYLAQPISSYQLHENSMTSLDGVDADIVYELARKLLVPESHRESYQEMLSIKAQDAILRLVKTYRTKAAWEVAISGNWRVRHALGRGGLKTTALLLAPWLHPRRSRSYKKFDQVALG